LEAASIHAPAGLHRISVPLLRLRSDDQLVALFREGHEDAFQVIHERYRQRLFAYARQMLSGSRSDAEDAMQDVFLRAYGALRADDRPVTLRAWLYRVAHNRCIDQLRRPLPAAIDLFDITRGPSLLDPLEQAERREDLRRLVSDVRRLPEQQRSALLMREMEGLTYKELADALRVSVPAVKSLLVRARIGLVEAIEARDTACCDIRTDVAASVDKGVRASALARRHMRECAPCREYRTALRGDLKQLHGLGSGPGLLATAAKLLGLGGAGSGAAAGTGAAGAGGGAAVVGGGAVATKVAVLACCAAVVGGGAVEVQHVAAPPAPKPRAVRTSVAPVPALRPIALPARHAAIPLLALRIGEPTHRVPARAPAVDPAPAPAPAAGVETPPAGAPPASDSPVVDQVNGGLLAPDDDADAVSDDPPASTGSSTGTGTTAVSGTPAGTGSSTGTTGSSPPAIGVSPGPGGTGADSGPTGSATGSSPPTAQGASAAGSTRSPA
jgi:RNA polymerase sigma factor (sigma-70 family)